ARTAGKPRGADPPPQATGALRAPYNPAHGPFTTRERRRASAPRSGSGRAAVALADRRQQPRGRVRRAVEPQPAARLLARPGDPLHHRGRGADRAVRAADGDGGERGAERTALSALLRRAQSVAIARSSRPSSRSMLS